LAKKTTKNFADKKKKRNFAGEKKQKQRKQ
jgi:hypothetical protein